MVEHYEVQHKGSEVIFKNQANGRFEVIDENLPVSMNMWGFTPDYFVHSGVWFPGVSEENTANIKAEYGIPTMVNKLLTEQDCRHRVLQTPANGSALLI